MTRHSSTFSHALSRTKLDANGRTVTLSRTRSKFKAGFVAF